MYNPFDPDTAAQIALNDRLNTELVTDVVLDAQQREKKLKAYIKELEESLEKWQAAWKKKDQAVDEQNTNIGHLFLKATAWKGKAKELGEKLGISEEELTKEINRVYLEGLEQDPELKQKMQQYFPEWIPKDED